VDWQRSHSLLINGAFDRAIAQSSAGAPLSISPPKMRFSFAGTEPQVSMSKYTSGAV
jgi:hypothetical protein